MSSVTNVGEGIRVNILAKILKIFEVNNVYCNYFRK